MLEEAFGAKVEPFFGNKKNSPTDLLLFYWEERSMQIGSHPRRSYIPKFSLESSSMTLANELDLQIELASAENVAFDADCEICRQSNATWWRNRPYVMTRGHNLHCRLLAQL